MKKALVIMLVCALLFSLVGCSSIPTADQESATKETVSAEATVAPAEASAEETAAEEDSYVIGVTIPNMENESNAIYADAMQEYADSLGNVELLITDGAGLAEKQVAQCETFVTQGVDAVILCPYDAEGCMAAAQVCVDAGIPVFTSKAEISDQSIVNTYVGADDFAGGKMEMQYIADLLGGKGNICVIEGPTGISAAILRTDGINEVLKNYPDIKILYSQPADWDRAVAMQTMENWLQLGEEIDAVVAENDEMALGAYDAIKDLGLEIPVIGIDAIEAALESVAAGELTATVLQDVKSIAIKAVDVAIMLAKGEKVEDHYYVDFILIDSTNIDQYSTK